MKNLTFLLTTLPLFGLSSYSTTVTSASSATISAATHGLGCASGTYFGLRLTHTSTNYVAHTGWSVSINGSCDFSFTFSPNFSGDIYIKGRYSVTSASTDFEPISVNEDSEGQAEIRVGMYCTDGYACVRAGYGISERGFVYSFPGQAEWASTTVRVYAAGGVVYFATSNGLGGDCTHAGGGPSLGDCVVVTNVTSFPEGSYQIFQGTITHPAGQYNQWSSTSDLRSWL